MKTFSCPTIIQHFTEMSIQRTRWEKIKCIKTGREEIKLYSQLKSLYIESLNQIPKIFIQVNKFSKVARFKIVCKNQLCFIYSNKEQSKKEIKKKIPFLIVFKRIKYLCMNFTNKVKELYTKTVKHYQKIKGDLNKWEDICLHGLENLILRMWYKDSMHYLSKF
jgi:hypothetical protein